MMKSPLMAPRHPSEPESTARNSPSGEERVRAEPFEAIELELALVWSE